MDIPLKDYEELEKLLKNGNCIKLNGSYYYVDLIAFVGVRKLDQAPASFVKLTPEKLGKYPSLNQSLYYAKIERRRMRTFLHSGVRVRRGARNQRANPKKRKDSGIRWKLLRNFLVVFHHRCKFTPSYISLYVILKAESTEMALMSDWYFLLLSNSTRLYKGMPFPLISG